MLRVLAWFVGLFVVLGVSHDALSQVGGPLSGDTSSSAQGASSSDSTSLQAYLKASNAELFDAFGEAVAISGNTIVVGARFEDSDATGVNGSQGNDPLFFAESGAAYVFVRDGSTWTQQAYLKASNTGFNDSFGHSVAISGDTIVVGTERENSNATGINGNQANDTLAFAGAAYVFVRNGTTWTQQAYIKASNTEANDQFAHSLALAGDTLVVGAPGEDSIATGVNSNQINNSASGAGAAYVYVRNGSIWSRQAYLKPSNTGAGDSFGKSVAVSGDTIVVGAWAEDSAATGVNGDQADDSSSNAGAAYVFVRNGIAWSQQGYLKASNTDDGDLFGVAVSLTGDTLVVGALSEDSSAKGIDGDQTVNSASNAGAAYVFVRDGTSWSQQAYVKASNAEGADLFGSALALSGSGNRLAVTAQDESGNATGVDGDQSGNGAFKSGAVYVFERFGKTWVQKAYLKGYDTNAFDGFGWSVGLTDDMLIAGVIGDDSASAGIGGNPLDNSSFCVGSVVAFDVVADTWTDLGGASLGTAGYPQLVGTGDLVGGTQASLDLTAVPPGVAVLAWVSFAPVSFAAVGGVVHAFPFANQFLFVADGGGALHLSTAWPLGVPPSTGVWFQFLVDDPGSLHGITLSNGQHALTP